MDINREMNQHFFPGERRETGSIKTTLVFSKEVAFRISRYVNRRIMKKSQRSCEQEVDPLCATGRWK